MTTIRSCIFDLDGTLLNTIQAISYTSNLVLADFGLPALDADFVPRYAGDGAPKLMERCLSQVLGHPADETLCKKATERYLEFFKEGCMHGVFPYPTMPELLKALKERGIAMAVVTNKPQAMAEKNIHGFFGDGLFDAIVGARDGLPLKPAPDGALLAARLLGSAPAECLYIGDTNTDMRTGAGAGMVLCGAVWGFRSREELAAFHPAFLADKPIDILEFLK